MPKKTKKSASLPAEQMKENREKRKALFRRAALLLLLFLLFELLYQGILLAERTYGASVPYGLLSYLAAAFLLLLFYLLLNHGLSREPVTEEMITGALEKAARIRMAHQINRDKKRARTLLYILLPIILVLFLDFLDLFVLTPLLSAIWASR